MDLFKIIEEFSSLTKQNKIFVILEKENHSFKVFKTHESF